MIYLRYYEDQPLDEIARITQQKLSTVKSRLYRAMYKLKAALLDENIQGYDLTNYNQNDTNRVPVYVFRKKGCGNCKNFLNYVAQNLLPTHGDKFRIVSYEVGNTPANFGLINKIQSYLLGNTTNTVATPYIIIGDKIFSGFIDISKQQQIEIQY